MTVSIRASLAFSAVAMALLTAAFADPPGDEDTALAGKPKPEHWSYTGEGGPEHWSEIATANALCSSGSQQSPVDLGGAIPASAKGPAGAWKAVRGGAVINNGHTIQVDVEGGSLMLDGVSYSLKQFHFHHPSEHTIDGKHFPLEVHLVHAAANGQLAVVGVMFEEGEANPALDPVWATAPGREGKAQVAFEIDPAKLVTSGAAYRYEGSLTTPPCSETVRWTVMAKPQTASKAQINAFAALFPDNARPVQQLNRRYVLKTD
jgi:carbonic anhydrase